MSHWSWSTWKPPGDIARLINEPYYIVEEDGEISQTVCMALSRQYAEEIVRLHNSSQPDATEVTK
jgi:hypothetical protein